jgi:hypothetical protein
LSKLVTEISYSKIDIFFYNHSSSDIRKSKRNRRAKDFGSDFHTFLIFFNNLKFFSKAFRCNRDRRAKYF